tara:strand:- start:592 stop:1212 length:621 start_codon:yes stop_codon:yes gene_type:complete
MPIIKDFKLDFSTRVIIWNMSESESDLELGIRLSKPDRIKIKSIKLESKRKEFFASRQILEYLNYNSDQIRYKKSGKPFLSNGKKISISNSFDMVMIALSDKEVGVDIEKKRKKIIRIADKFIHQNEYFGFKNDIIMLTQLWTIKEAVYKSYDKQGLSFSKQIIASPFKINDNIGKAHIVDMELTKFFSLIFIKIENYCATIALPN